jgi:hypothetical protein
VGDKIESEDNRYVTADVYITDAKIISDVQNKKLVEISAGYDQDLVSLPGEIDGERYDAVQTNIVINHVLLVPPGGGRAGRNVGLRLDSNGDQIGGKTVKIVINSREFEVQDDLGAAVVALQGDLDKHRGQADAASARADSLQTELSAALDPKKIDEILEHRAKFLEEIRAVDPGIRLDGKSEEELLREAAKKIKTDLSGSESLDYLRGLLQGRGAVRGDTADTVSLGKTSEMQRRVRWTPDDFRRAK